MPRDQVTLRVSARPVRILSLVNSREDITRSIRLFTHLWGGSANVILPAPAAPAQGRIEQRFEKAIRAYDPDYVLTPPGGISTEAQSLLDSIACYADSLTKHGLESTSRGRIVFTSEKRRSRTYYSSASKDISLRFH